MEIVHQFLNFPLLNIVNIYKVDRFLNSALANGPCNDFRIFRQFPTHSDDFRSSISMRELFVNISNSRS